MDNDFTSLLLRYREAKGLTQAQCAFHLDVSEGTVAAWEQENRTPGPFTEKIARRRMERSLKALSRRERVSADSQPLCGPGDHPRAGV